MPLIRLTDVPPVLQTWDPIPLELARDWCAVMIDHMPLSMTPSFMHFMQSEVREDGITDTAEWIWVAKEFHAVGFTPAEWLQLTEYVPNALITLAVGKELKNGGMIRLRAEPWLPWLERTRAGEVSLSVVTEMLKGHWGEPASVIPFGEFPNCSL